MAKESFKFQVNTSSEHQTVSALESAAVKQELISIVAKLPFEERIEFITELKAFNNSAMNEILKTVEYMVGTKRASF
ncbi:hypothetical protein [Pantoea agglomerans]|uniref:hypothetical protein n=1 Tax=Enterobacter agglomerans TaxID=549 RepID=UPI003C7DE5B9